MPINVFGNRSNYSGNKIDTSLFVQKTYWRTNCIESNIEEDIDLKNQYKIINLPNPTNIRDACTKNYADNLFNDPSIIKNSAHIDLNDRNITNASFIQVNQLPQIDSHLTANLYVDTQIDQLSLVRNNQDNDFGNYNLSNINSITLNKEAENDNEVLTKSYVDQFHQENERSRRDVGLDFYNESAGLVKNNQDNDLNDKKLTNLDSVTVNRNPFLHNELASKAYIDDELDKNTIVRLNDNSIDRYLQVRINNTAYNLQIYNKTQIIDTTKLILPNTGTDLLQIWKIVCNNKLGEGIPSDFIKSTRTNSPTGSAGATTLPLIGTCFIYIETSANNHDGANDKVFVSFERTDIIHISKITFYYNRYSKSTPDKRNMSKFEIQLLRNGSWQTEYLMDKDTNFSISSTDWTLFNMDIISQPNYGIKLVYSGINTAHADMCFSDINITHSIFLKTCILVCIPKYIYSYKCTIIEIMRLYNNTYSNINYSYNCNYPYFKWKI